MTIKYIEAGVLLAAYHEYGAADGWPCILCHGFPYDALAYRDTATALAEQGARVVVPYLRGYGTTRFLSPDTLRSGQQGALGADLLAFMDALEIDRAILGGYDWGGRAACVVAALWPERAAGLISGNSYNIQNIAKSWHPAAPEQESAYWYQYYFHSERGRRGLDENRDVLARLLWRQWSPTWHFDDATFAATAASFTNPDFVEVVIHSYRHRYGLILGDPAYATIEERLSAQPPIRVPAITIDGSVDGVATDTSHHAPKFEAHREHRLFDDAGHNLPQEKPAEWTKAVLDLHAIVQATG